MESKLKNWLHAFFARLERRQPPKPVEQQSQAAQQQKTSQFDARFFPAVEAKHSPKRYDKPR